MKFGSTRGFLTLLSACASALCLGLAAPASGFGAVPAVQDDRLAVLPMVELETRLDMIAATGAKVTRVDLFWSDVATAKPAHPEDPNDQAYVWDRYDQIFLGLKARKITPIVAVYNSPTWATGGKVRPGVPGYNAQTPNPGQFGRFMGAVAKRYSGRFSNPFLGILPRVRNWEIWNEPNLNRYLFPQYKGKKNVSLKAYVLLVKAAYPRIKKANPKAIVIAGSAGPKSKSDTSGLGSRAWLAGIIKSKVKFDAYSQHIYPAAPPKGKTKAFPTWRSIPEILKTLNGLRKNIPLYITEAGYTTATTRFRKVKVAPKAQASFLTQIFGLKDVKQKRVPVVVWFNLQDNPDWPGGLVRQNGTQKPSYKTFRKVAVRSKLPTALR
jgi:polysaccharide biosynthesis protein PslG